MRFKNFNKVKPIVQNVKTNSVNEGKAPSQADPDNFNDWNPALAHEDVSEAKKGDKGGSKGTASSGEPAGGVAGALQKYLSKKQKEQREERIKARNKQAHKELTDKLQNKWKTLKDQNTKHMEDYEAASDKGDDAAIYVIKKAINGIRTQLENLQNRMEANNVPLPFKGAAPIEIPSEEPVEEPAAKEPAKEPGKFPIEEPVEEPEEEVLKDEASKDLEDADKVEKVIKGEEEAIEKEPAKEPEEEVIPPEEVAKDAKDAGEFTEEEVEKETPKEEQQETALKALKATDAIESEEISDLHELAKAGGSGEEFMGRTLEIYTGITRCSDSAQFFVVASLKDKGYPEFWKGFDGNCYQNTSIGSRKPAGTKLPSGILFEDSYEGIAYSDCTCT